MKKQILIPVNGSDLSDKAIEFTAELVGTKNIAVHLIHVVKPTTIPKAIGKYMRTENIQEDPHTVYLNLMGRPIVEKAQDKAGGCGISEIKAIVLPGDPAEVIVDYASESHIDMIVMGTRGLGSIATKVCRESDRTCIIVRRELLDGKRVIIVDDEPDILETIEELLPMCRVTTASSFEQAKELMETEAFDLAILDIMGVNGYELLKIANEQRIIAVMLTAHALSPENTIRSFKEGAAYYIPKEKMVDITTYLNDVLEARERGKSFWSRWFERFGSYYEEKFGSTLKVDPEEKS
jgi:nucleotide-binding universal stress UspA family protein/CheY-like chemotaxis protein